MEGLCLLLVVLWAVSPGRGTPSQEVTAMAPARERDRSPRFGLPTAPPEPTSPPNTTAGNTTEAPGPGALRLAGGRSRCEGRVELEQEGTWGTVCDDGWDLPDADVVCQQLLCGRALRAHGGDTFGRGTGPILLDEVRCQGHERRLWECPAEREHDCTHKEDAGVVCSEHQEWRLSGGLDPCAGRVEVFFRGTWSTVCDSSWYQLEARVLCHTLGCGEPLQHPSFSHTLPSKMLYLCEGDPPSLAHCQWTYNKSAPCHQSRAAGVVCNGSQGLQTPPQLATGTPSDPPRAEEGSPAVGTLSPWHVPLFALCLVLAALLLLALLAFAAALLRMRKMRAHAVPSLGPAGPILVAHSTQSPNVPSGISNDYREMPPNLPKGADPPGPAAKGSDSDSDYEHYDFSREPPLALSTFYNSLRQQPREQLLPLMPTQDGMEPFPREVPAELDPPSRGSSSTSSCSSATEPYCNNCPPIPTRGTHQHVAPPTHGYTDWHSSAPHVPAPVPAHPVPPVSPAAPDATDGSSTSSGEWYENVQRGDPPPQPGWPAPSCPSRGHPQDLDSEEEEGSDYDDIQGSAP